MALALPSSTLVWVSRTTDSMPRSAKSALSHDNRTGSLVRMSSFTAPSPPNAIVNAHRPSGLDRPSQHPMLILAGARVKPDG